MTTASRDVEPVGVTAALHPDRAKALVERLRVEREQFVGQRDALQTGGRRGYSGVTDEISLRKRDSLKRELETLVVKARQAVSAQDADQARDIARRVDVILDEVESASREATSRTQGGAGESDDASSPQSGDQGGDDQITGAQALARRVLQILSEIDHAAAVGDEAAESESAGRLDVKV